MHDGELVAAKARHQVGISNALTQPVRHRLEEEIADRMAVRIIHVLEAIKIETEYGDVLSLPGPCQQLPQLFVKLRSVGQIGQRIVVRHIGNFRLCFSLLGNVLVGCDPTAGSHR